MKAQASTTNAAAMSTSKNHNSGVIDPYMNTIPDYPVRAADVPERASRPDRQIR